jgi:hypothetical protein
MGPMRKFPQAWQPLLLGLVILGLSAVSCTAERSASSKNSEGTSTSGATKRESSIHELSTIEALKDAFNQDAGNVRVVLLLSPT